MDNKKSAFRRRADDKSAQSLHYIETRTPEQIRKKSTLRRRAEDRSAQSLHYIETQTPEQIQETLHELRVHQIELEMQNEELRRAQSKLEAERARYFAFYNLSPVGFLTLSRQGLILEANSIVAAMLGTDIITLIKQPISRFIFKEDQDAYYLHCKRLSKIHSGLRQDFSGASNAGEAKACELRMMKKDGAPFWARLESLMVHDPTMNSADSTNSTSPQQANSLQAPHDTDTALLVSRVVINDITDRKKAEEALQKAFDDIKTLRGIVPICAWCKKIRDDDGYWNQVEVYVRDHTEAEFSHGICPECSEKHYSGILGHRHETTDKKEAPQ
jgi:PAS domain-containing protein